MTRSHPGTPHQDIHVSCSDLAPFFLVYILLDCLFGTSVCPRGRRIDLSLATREAPSEMWRPPGPHRNVGARWTCFGHRPPSEPCPCMVKQISSPPDLDDLSLSRHCHSRWSPDLRSLVARVKRSPSGEKTVSPAPTIPCFVQWGIDTENLPCLPFFTPQRDLAPPDVGPVRRRLLGRGGWTLDLYRIWGYVASSRC